jgi:LPS-assembly protein
MKKLSLSEIQRGNKDVQTPASFFPATLQCPSRNLNRIRSSSLTIIGRNTLRILSLAFMLSVPLTQNAFSEQEQSCEANQVRTEIPYRDGKVILCSDSQESIEKVLWQAKGNVKIFFEDIVITTDEAVYNKETREGHTVGKTHFSQGDQWLTCSRAEFNFGTQTGTFYDATGYTDREFLISGRTIIKTGPDTYRVQDGSITTCKDENPKWKFTASRSEIRVDHTARLHNTFLKIKGLPVFYMPYTILPLEKKKRSSGFTTFSTGSSTSKGRVFSQGYYQTLGRSADIKIYGDYFSLRGLALGGLLRTRPNPSTFFNIEVYGIRDNRNQGGVRLVVDGESLMRNDWRAVARVNITSNFEFRQAFANNFSKATVSREHVNLFLTRNHGSLSTNIAFERNEVKFPGESLVTRKIPSIEFLSLGTPLGNSPFIFSFQSSIDGISRRDGQSETGGIIQRLDIYPRMAIRLPSLLGFSLIPSLGVRKTYYGAQISDDTDEGIVHESLNRHYADLSIDLKTPFLEKDYKSSWLGSFQHILEPYVTYRWTHGIKDLQQIVRFDENDVIADTSEIEYGIVNRFFTKRKNGAGTTEKHEVLVVALTQKYYFDPSFGGAFLPEHANSFYPLNTATGFYQTGVERNLSPISATVRIRLKSSLSHDFMADYDPKLQHLRNASFWTHWKGGKFSITTTYFHKLKSEPELFASHQLQGTVSYGSARRGFSSSLTVRYNIQTSTLLNSRSRFGYAWDCCSVSTEFKQYDLGVRTESQFSFSFGLKGIGSFGSQELQDDLF